MRPKIFPMYRIPVLFCLLNCSLFQMKASIADSVMIENLIFEGAGIRGIAFCGALMELDSRGQLECIERVGGTSSGAITAALVSIGYTPTETYEIIGSTDFGKFNDGSFGVVGGLTRLNKKQGYYRGKSFLHWVENLIEKKTGKKNLTFRELHALRQHQMDGQFKELVIAATSLNHQRSIFFSYQSYPDMRIADAVHASMAIPLYFEPVIINQSGSVVSNKEMSTADHLCVDGGFTANFIIGYFDETKPTGELIIAPTLGLRIDSDPQIEEDLSNRNLAYQSINSTADFIGAFYYMIKETMNRTQLTEEDWQRTISISDCEMSPKVKKLSVAEKEMLIKAGKVGVANYFEASR